MTRSNYAVTYAPDGALTEAHGDVVPTIVETVARLRREGADVEFLGATQEVDGAGKLVEVTARYAAASKGAVGRVSYRSSIPACGSPRPVAGADPTAGRRTVDGR